MSHLQKPSNLGKRDCWSPCRSADTWVISGSFSCSPNKTSIVSGLVRSLRIRDTDPGPSTSMRVIPVKGLRMPKMSPHSKWDRHRTGLLRFSLSAPDAPTSQMRSLWCSLQSPDVTRLNHRRRMTRPRLRPDTTPKERVA